MTEPRRGGKGGTGGPARFRLLDAALFMTTRVSDVHIIANTALPTPREMVTEIPRSDRDANLVRTAREEIARILSGEDDRFLLIVGPCSIHDLKGGREYAERLAQLAAEV